MSPPGGIGVDLRFNCKVSCSSSPSPASNSSQSSSNTSYSAPPYSINNGNKQLPISTKTIAATATHKSGEVEYNLHNLYGLQQVKATFEKLAELRQRRPFILTRWVPFGRWTTWGLTSADDIISSGFKWHQCL